MKSVNTAEADPNIKNFIVDLSCNSGGTSDVVSAMGGILYNDTSIRTIDKRTGEVKVISFKLDKNMDGKFDEKDDAVKYDLHFAGLTSGVSFSCGNLLPCLMKENGLPIIGATSGGGSCNVELVTTSLGYPVFISAANELIYKDRTSVDAGAAPNYPIEIGVEQDVNYDFSGFYDIAKLSEYVNSYYK